MGALLLIGVAASVYLVYVLEILKLRRLRAWQLRRDGPGHERARDRRSRSSASSRPASSALGRVRTGFEPVWC